MEKPAKKSTRKPATKPNITIQVVEVTDETKKKGRKPKGGKLITKLDESVQQTAPLANIILHLKCSTKELNEYMEKCNKMNYDGTSYDPSAPPKIMTYNGINADQYALYDEYGLLDNDAYKEQPIVVTDCCKICKEKMDMSDITTDDSEISMKDVNAKLKKLKIVLYKNSNTEHKSACFWCTYEYDNPSCYIPKYENDGNIFAYGSFCRPECAAAYLMKETMDDSTKFERYHLLNRIYGKIYGYKKNIKPAPNPYYILEKFYGTLTIQEYRKMLKTDHMLLTIDKPMTRLMPELHEETDETLLNIGNSTKPTTKTTGNYKVKRQSEKVSGPSKTNIMKTAFGITN